MLLQVWEEGLCMKNFKKTIKTIVLFLIVLTIFSSAIMELFLGTESYFYQDAKERDGIAGTIDYVVIGSSHGLRAFRPEILDEELDVNSYNLSGSLMTMLGKYEMLTKEIDRNPVKTVVLEMASSTIPRNRKNEGPEGEIYILGRFSKVLPRISYFFKSIRPSEYGKTYYAVLNRGVKCFYKLRNGKLTQYNTKAYKGYAEFKKDFTDISINYKKKFNSQSLDCQIYQPNIDYLDKIVDYCKSRDIRLIIVTTPVSLTTVCRYDNFDWSYEWYKKYCSEHDLEFYDFNLLKERTELFSDKGSFHDRYHLGNTGAKVFTNYFCDFMKKVDKGEDVSDLFYDSYAEFDANQFYSQK